MKHKIINKLQQLSVYDWLALALSLIYFLALLVHINYFKAPHGDIYQYIREGHDYLSGQVPHIIHPQPLFSIIVVLLQPLFSFLEFPYFAAAKFLNIFAASGMMLITYLIVKKKTTASLAIMSVVIATTHPITTASAFDTTNVGIYSFFALLTLYFAEQNSKKRRWFFASLLAAFFIRIEALAIISAHMCTSGLKKLKKDAPWLMISGLIIGLWITFQTIHNLDYDMDYGNYYVYEISERKFDANNLVYSLGLFGAMFFPQQMSLYELNLNQNTVVLMLSYILVTAAMIMTKSTRKVGLYLFGVSLIHSIFPAIEPRYLVLFLHGTIIGSSVLAFEIYQKHKHKKWIQVVLIGGSLLFFAYYSQFLFKHYANNLSDYRNTAIDLNHQVYDWIFNHTGRESYQIIANESELYYQPFLYSTKYLSNKTNPPLAELVNDNFIISFTDRSLSFVRLNEVKNNCQSATCLLNRLNTDQKILLISGPEIMSSPSNDFWIQHNGTFLLKELLLKEHCLKQLVVFRNPQLYRRIDEFDFNCYLEK